MRRAGSLGLSAQLGKRALRVLGYSFREPEAAWRARQILTERYELGPDDASVADLADDGVLLAVRAREDNLDGVTRILTEHGGEPLTNIDERWTGRADH